MEITVTRADLSRELSIVASAVDRKSTIPVLATLLLEADDAGLHLTATDLSLGLVCSCPAKVVEPGRCAILAKRLLDYIRLLPAGDIRLKRQENDWVSITCGRSRTRIAGLPADNYPEIPEGAGDAIALPVPALRRMIQQTQFAISREEARYTLMGSLLMLRAQSLTMVATDGHRLAHVVVDLPEPLSLRDDVVSHVLPLGAMQELLRLTDTADDAKTVDFRFNDNHLFFSVAGRRLIASKLHGSFPDYARAMPKEHAHQVHVPKAELRAALERVAQFSDERSRAVKLRMGSVVPAGEVCSVGGLTVFGTITDTGDSEETLTVEYGGAEVEIGFNASYLLDALKVLGGDQVRLCFSDGQRAAELREADEDGYRYVVMPMRV